MEDDTDFLVHSARYGFTLPMDGNQRLKGVFSRIISTATTDDSAEGGYLADAETRRLRVTSFTTGAYTLLISKFFKSFGKPLAGPERKNIDEDFIWVLRLGRRLWRVARYLTQLNIFARSGLQFIRNTLGDRSKGFAGGGQGVEIVWIGDKLFYPTIMAARFK